MIARGSTTIELTILSDEANEIADALRQKIANHSAFTGFEGQPTIELVQVASRPEDINAESVTVMLADPDLASVIISRCSSLTWCQSTWAGNAPLLNSNKTDYILTGLKGIFGKLMREYVFAYLLSHARNVKAFERNQRGSQPKWEAAKRLPLHGQTLGIVGLGSIGQALIPVAHAFGMNVVGLTRSGKEVEGAKAVFTPDNISTFADASDHVVNLMPDTPSTQNMLSYDFFNALKPHSLFLNAGRGSAVNDDALLQALNGGVFAHAVLDVFRQEPLDKAHPFWHHPNISVTAHTAAESQPSDVADVFLENALRYINGESLIYQFDFKKGY
ncbi:D-2-hydroxyacid dehydrogenase [Alteromonas gracilis]|uniref:D-2-hydroxyacid dehydrogenase n=1 Tax=Alteromonas gracilis TaxID=1479524 RepID=UPI0037351F18